MDSERSANLSYEVTDHRRRRHHYNYYYNYYYYCCCNYPFVKRHYLTTKYRQYSIDGAKKL